MSPTVLGIEKPVIAMLHVPALPGSPRNTLSFKEIIQWVVSDADALVSQGVDALILENFGDTPFFPERVPPHTATFLTTLGCAVKSHVGSVPLGINVLRNDPISALAVAAAVEAEFIRVNIHTGARVADQGLIEGAAHETLRYRKTLGRQIQIFADVNVKHSAPLALRSLTDEITDTVLRGCADAIILTGPATGKETPLEDLKTGKAAGVAPILAGSGVDAGDIAAVLGIADGVIVGTALKKDAVTTNRVDPERVRRCVSAARRARP